MSKYAISPEGVESLRTLSKELKQTVLSIETTNRALQSKISSVMDSLGIYGIEIWDITLKAKDSLDSKIDDVNLLCESLEKNANEIEGILGSDGLSAAGQSSGSGTGKSAARPDIATASAMYSSARNSLDSKKVEHKAIETFCGERTTDSIVQRLGGGDKTEGSCSSLAFAYAGNKAGYDVLDFRDGASREFFSSNSSIAMIAALPGVDAKIESGCDDIACADKLLSGMEPEREYYLATGQHAAIVRLHEGHYEYLELQSATRNGWNILHDRALCDRFGCDLNQSEYPNFLIDVDSLSQSREFLDLLGYINTDESAQVKGDSGHVR